MLLFWLTSLLLLFNNNFCSFDRTGRGFEPDLSSEVLMFWKGISNAKVRTTEASTIAMISFKFTWNRKIVKIRRFWEVKRGDASDENLLSVIWILSFGKKFCQYLVGTYLSVWQDFIVRRLAYRPNNFKPKVPVSNFVFDGFQFTFFTHFFSVFQDMFHTTLVGICLSMVQGIYLPT